MKRLFSTLIIVLFTTLLMGQNHLDYQFKDLKILGATEVKNQEQSSTCWAFAGISFLESELIRMGKGEHELSEMWIVRNAYLEKAIRYVRLHGVTQFRPGGTAIDVINIVKKYGIVPESVYQGLNYGTSRHNHGELHEALKSYLADIIKNRNGILSTAWLNGFEAILDTYLGELPTSFTYKGKDYTPESFAKELSFNYDNYKVITSFESYPQDKYVQLEFPDNWCWMEAYNVPFKELVDIIDHSIDKGFTVSIAMDITNRNFMRERGIAVVPAVHVNAIRPEDKTGIWEKITNEELLKLNEKNERPGPERRITPVIRGRGFNNYFVTDDHLVHIIGTARDQYGKKYFKIKDSSGKDGIRGKGQYVYASESYLQYYTFSYLVNTESLPSRIVNKMKR